MRKHSQLIDISLSVSPLKNALGKIVGASKIARDITERKRNEAQLSILAHEAEHRTKILLATVQATVHLTQAETVADLKAAMEGRIQALANVHTLFVRSRWAGAELYTLITQELAPYCRRRCSRSNKKSPTICLSPPTLRPSQWPFMSWRPMRPNMGRCPCPKGEFTLHGRLQTDCTFAGSNGGPPVTPPTRQGFGTRVISRMVTQTGGDIRFDWHPEGFACEIAITTGSVLQTRPAS